MQIPNGFLPLIMIMPLVLFLSAVSCRAAASGKLTRNHLAGYRFPALLASDKAWKAGHEAAYRPSAFGFFGAALAAIRIFTVHPLLFLVEILCFILGLGSAITLALKAAQNVGF